MTVHHRPSPAYRVFAAFIAIALVAGCGRLIPSGQQTVEPSELKAGTYNLDPAHARLLWKVNHLGFSTYVGEFTDFDASLDFDPEAPEHASLSVIVETASINTGDPDFDVELAGSDWLDSAAFPHAVFETRSIEITGDNTGTATGNLTLHGVTQPIDIDIIFNGGADNFLTSRYTLGFEASTSINRSDFGIDYLVPAIGDEITFEIHAEFIDG